MSNRFFSSTVKYSELALVWGCYLLAGIAGVTLVFMMGMIVVDVFFRYVLDTPLIGVYDLVKLSMVVVAFCSLAYTGLKGAHITVDLCNPVFARIRPRWIDALLYRLVMFMASGTVLWLAYLSLDQASKSEAMREASTMIGVPHYPFYGVIAVGLVFYGLVLLADAIRGGQRLVPVGSNGEQGEAS
ncbi:TRAP transporter small permease [Marinobacter sp. ATCH36]|uniref:TRAP transporter small permease n=1 Tax=Marinobacter sp. ATCH36 TaxID=2945106 RepID=UPI002020BDC3|nr:TRAP transporter small permease [Marinobacter sp. ATCH36]MCL7942945.1 TRAP transporter small permease [Marinobacter sp. ATCH36]